MIDISQFAKQTLIWLSDEHVFGIVSGGRYGVGFNMIELLIKLDVRNSSMARKAAPCRNAEASYSRSNGALLKRMMMMMMLILTISQGKLIHVAINFDTYSV